MKYYILIKTSTKDIFPDVISIRETFGEALEALYQEMDKNYNEYYNLDISEEDKKEIQEELEEDHYFDFKDYRYSIIKYWE